MKTNRLGLGLIAGMAVTMIAATPLRTALTLQPESKIWVSGKSSVKDFRCQAKTIDANLTAGPGAAELSKLVATAAIIVPVATLDCGNGTMNEHMLKALQSKDHPRITFKLASYTIGAADDITLTGVLTIAGKDQRVELKGKVTEQNGIVRSSATKDIDMTQWGVKPPSLMMGTMKVKPVVTIGYDIALKR